ncbi:phage tail sheath family protein [Pyxidicoccus xibeiensis]|uniref:phage tail sheath family protein n=1 Tax=Pyxidicoccus xibeiensis TaxID=2906759 RepID=UPI0020A807F5|nr:phage tail sheath subtilisin-like domain-containing protein [Pyxidicoccus xibeiensis]MCP3137368.1 phage tail sheath subtilisin-like domain-containing protein [Pyxidicoccus xibeiensis]
MPEYLAPGVFVEETSFRSKSIEGVSTTTTGFVGPTRYGPVDLEPELVTSVVEFERIYGNRRQLAFKTIGSLHNYTWHAVRAFFEEGGKRLYISRVYRKPGDTTYTGLDSTIDLGGGTTVATEYADGHARTLLDLTAANKAETLALTARYPGSAGNFRVRFSLRVGQNVLSFDAGAPRVGALLPRDVVLIRDIRSPISSPVGSGEPYLAEWDEDAQDWRFTKGDSSPITSILLSSITEGDGYEIRVITAAVTVIPTDDPASAQTWDGLALDPAHTRAGAEDSLSARFGYDAADTAKNRDVPIIISVQDLTDGLGVLQAFLDASLASPPMSPPLDTALEDPDSPESQRSLEVLLKGGSDGVRPTADEYKGQQIVNTTRKTGLVQFEDLEDISIVAAPGSTFGYENGYGNDAASIINLLISHAQRMKYRIAVLDSGNGQTLSQVRALRAKIDSSHAALYYPWVKVLDPVTRQPIFLPPSGFVAGIYARNDVNRAVYKAPANEVVNLALGFEFSLSKAQQEVLNPEGINAFRFFEGRGNRLWGARTTSSDPEWKYVNLRRYFAYLERSIDKGTQWAVFEPNGEQLWANVRRTIEDFMLNEWQAGALLGDKPEKAYFVKCDRSTMSQNDLDNGRLVCLIGVAPLRPAEFVIFRIGQWTGDRK